jgi:hypothetical protein
MPTLIPLNIQIEDSAMINAAREAARKIIEQKFSSWGSGNDGYIAIQNAINEYCRSDEYREKIRAAIAHHADQHILAGLRQMMMKQSRNALAKEIKKG